MLKDRKDTAIHIAYDEYEPFDASVPEKNLLRAVLLTAMSDLGKPGEAGRKAQEYFLSPEEDYVFSFQSVCNYLSIDPSTILVITGLRKIAGEQVQEESKQDNTPSENTAEDEKISET